ncbi:MAG: ATP-dependent DNA helicase [Gammaproteobacteria bacterium]|nr:ATP-dependent DNA helicase [Gammaproteobacteria bacterium]
MQTITELLGEHGPLAQHLSGFAPRAQQQAMAEQVIRTLEKDGLLIAEAGTGTGKTFAYLVPALLHCQGSGKKVMISTGTKNLQDQLYHRDLPTVRDALGVSTTVALLKGRANYLCHYRLEMQEGRRTRPQQQDQLARIRAWSRQTKRGDTAELSAVPEDSPVWPMVTSTSDNCLGGDCPAYSECFVMQARKDAQEADVIVVNHHLFFADMALRDEGFGEVLPGVNAFIFDEAHQLPEVASVFFGLNFSSRQLQDLGRDTLIEVHAEAPDEDRMQPCLTALDKAARDFRLALGVDNRRAPWKELATQTSVHDSAENLLTILNRLAELLDGLAQRGKGLERCWRRALELRVQLGQFLVGDEPLTADSYEEDNATESIESTETGVPGSQVHIQWFETHSRGFVLHMTPLEIHETFRSYVDKQRSAWIFTSATLAVGDSFTHFARNLGLDDAASQRWDSPFDFARQALLYVPTDLPQPNTPDYTTAVVEAARPVINAAGGRTFFLLTSHRALREVARQLEGSIDFPLLVQGTLTRPELLERFRELGNAVLIGTSSFWEGVDVRGEALSCVVIDKLPFSSPGEPVLQARLEAMREQGLNPFFDHQVPQAVITLKQGVGRLIRDVQDSGVLMICDPRLFGKSYGRIFRNSLPPMPVTRDAADVKHFFEVHRN